MHVLVGMQGSRWSPRVLAASAAAARAQCQQTCSTPLWKCVLVHSDNPLGACGSGVEDVFWAGGAGQVLCVAKTQEMHVLVGAMQQVEPMGWDAA